MSVCECVSVCVCMCMCVCLPNLNPLPYLPLYPPLCLSFHTYPTQRARLVQRHLETWTPEKTQLFGAAGAEGAGECVELHLCMFSAAAFSLAVRAF